MEPRILSTPCARCGGPVTAARSDVKYCGYCKGLATRERHRNDKRRYRKQNPERVRAAYRSWFIPKKYGITLEQWDALFQRQGRACAICRSDTPGWSKGWHTDHDHACCPGTPACGRCVRGILCHHCNLLIGLAAESPERLVAAATYVSTPVERN